MMECFFEDVYSKDETSKQLNSLQSTEKRKYGIGNVFDQQKSKSVQSHPRNSFWENSKSRTNSPNFFISRKQEICLQFETSLHNNWRTMKGQKVLNSVDMSVTWLSGWIAGCRRDPRPNLVAVFSSKCLKGVFFVWRFMPSGSFDRFGVPNDERLWTPANLQRLQTTRKKWYSELCDCQKCVWKLTHKCSRNSPLENLTWTSPCPCP